MDIQFLFFRQQLVEQFESYFGIAGIVKSPDFIQDRSSGEMREVDISLRVKIGSTEALVIVECRNREEVEDARWVEQVATKRDHLGATKAIMVTNKPMTEPARKKAEFCNVATRTVTESAKLEDVREWFGSDFVGFVTRLMSSDLGDWSFKLSDEDHALLVPGGEGLLGVHPDHPVFRSGFEEQLLSLNQIWKRECHRLSEIHDQFGPDKRPFQMKVVPCDDPSRCYYLVAGDRDFLLHELVITGHTWVTESTELPKRAFLYADETKKALAKMIVHEVRIPGQPGYELTLVHSEGGPVQLLRKDLND